MRHKQKNITDRLWLHNSTHTAWHRLPNDSFFFCPLPFSLCCCGFFLLQSRSLLRISTSSEHELQTTASLLHVIALRPVVTRKSARCVSSVVIFRGH